MKWIYIVLLFPITINAQETAFFETTFWLNDASGNQDSIIVGHDIDANYYNNPQFGELDINVPWDSIFEVRAAHFLAWHLMDDSLVLSKKIIARNEQGLDPNYDCLWFNEGIVIFVRSMHLPITIRWNRSAFEDSFCRNRSTLTPNIFPIIFPDWYIDLEADVDYVCLAERDSFIVHNFNWAYSFYLIDSVQGGSIDTINALFFDSESQREYDSPCTSIVSVGYTESNQILQLYPNPTENFINIKGGECMDWQVMDVMGKNIKHGKSDKIDISDCGVGLYFINLFDQKGILIYSGKILKI